MKIKRIQNDIDLTHVDSIYFIGMTDSVGSLKANKKLGEKRAREVARLFYPIFVRKPKARIFSKGELLESDPQKSRRVDVIIFSQVEEEIVEKTEAILPKCWKRADSLLHRSSIKEVVYRRKSYILIETSFSVEKCSFYAISTDSLHKNLSDSQSIYKLTWRKRRTSKENGYFLTKYVRIPVEDFNTYEVLVGDNACSPCSFQLTEYIKNTHGFSKTCWQVDRFLMSQVETRIRRANPSFLTVRVPKSFVNSEEEYFVGCNFKKPMKWRPIENKRKWNRLNKRDQSKVLFKKRLQKKMLKLEKGEYVYSEVPIFNSCAKKIVRKMNCCVESPEPSECDDCMPRYCGCPEHWTTCFCLQVNALPLLTDIGYRNMGNGSTWIASIGSEFGVLIEKKFITTPSLSIGITDSMSAYIDFRIKNTIFAIPFYPRGSHAWSYDEAVYGPKTILYLNMTYSATYMNISDDNSGVSQSLLAELEWYGAFRIPRSSLYVNTGVGLIPSVSQMYNVNPQFQFGIRSRFYR